MITTDEGDQIRWLRPMRGISYMMITTYEGDQVWWLRPMMGDQVRWLKPMRGSGMMITADEGDQVWWLRPMMGDQIYDDHGRWGGSGIWWSRPMMGIRYGDYDRWGGSGMVITTDEEIRYVMITIDKGIRYGTWPLTTTDDELNRILPGFCSLINLAGNAWVSWYSNGGLKGLYALVGCTIVLGTHAMHGRFASVTWEPAYSLCQGHVTYLLFSNIQMEK